MTRLSIRLLGGFQVDLGGVPVVNFKSDKVRALLAFLAYESNQSHPRDSLAWLLWPDASDKAARASLRGALSNLRKAIDDIHASPSFLIINRETIQFNPASNHWLDISTFLSAPLDTSTDINPIEHFKKAIALYRGPFLNGFSLGDSAPFEEWVVLKREAINRHLMAFLCSMADQHEQEGDYELAQTPARRMVELEPWNEEAHRRLMRLLALGGQRSQALAQYEICCRDIAKELNVEPSRETNALYEAIRNGKLAAFPIFPPAQTVGKRTALAEAGKSLFVGRWAELDRLDSFLKKTLAGEGQVALITGSSGSGKTALMSEFLRRAMHDHEHLITLSGGCNTYTGIGDPYLPFMEVIGQLAGDFGGKISGGVISPQQIQRLLAIFSSTSQILLENGPDLINRMIPAKALLERALISNYSDEAWQQKLDTLVERSEGEQVSTELRQLDLFEQFTRVLLSVAIHNPLILIVDDLQWADIGSISLLFHLGRRISGSHVLIIGAYRSEEVSLGQDGKQHPLEPVLHEFQRDFGEIMINLDRCDGQEFIAALLDSEPNQLSPAFRELLFHHTAGHPLFTIELLRSMQDGGELIQDDTGKWIAGKTVSWDRLPQRVEAVIAERVGRLPRELRHILEAASVEGNEFTAEVLASVLQVDEEALVRQLSEQLEHQHHLATATQFRRLGGQRISGYRFHNQLFQKYLYDSLDHIEQAYLHDAVGQTIEKFYQPYPEERDIFALDLARHFEKARIDQKAIYYLQIAGKRAERLSACNEAIVIYRHALELCAALTDTSEHLHTKIVLSMALGAQLIALGGYSSVELEQVYTRAQRLCQELAERLDEPRLAASRLIPILLEFGAYHGHRAQFQAAREIYDQVLALAEAAEDPQSMMLANWGPGYLLVSAGEFASARSHLEQALEAYEFRKHKDQITILMIDMGVSCLSWLSWTSFLLGFPNQALLQSRQAIALAREISHPLSLAFALAVAAVLQSLMLDAKRTQALAEQAIAICREKGFLYWLSVSIAYHGLALAWQKEYQAGISQMKEGEAIWRASGAYIGMAEHLITLGEVLGNCGQVDEGLKALEEAFVMIQKSGEEMYASELYRTKGLLLLKLSNANQVKAEACFREAIKIANNQQAKILELRATTSLCGLLVKQGRKEEARQMLAAIYGWFTEGFETQDLILASKQLAELD